MPGLASLPTALQPIREEVGLVGKPWKDLGKPWHSLATLWLRAEVLLAKTGRPDIGIKDIHNSSLPMPLKDWLYSKLLHQDAPCRREDFECKITDYLLKLPWETITHGDGILEQVWCHPGRTGIIIFLLGLYWQADSLNVGMAWQENLQRVETIFWAILQAPNL